jgi:hypothetical protein
MKKLLRKIWRGFNTVRVFVARLILFGSGAKPAPRVVLAAIRRDASRMWLYVYKSGALRNPKRVKAYRRLLYSSERLALLAEEGLQLAVPPEPPSPAPEAP